MAPSVGFFGSQAEYAVEYFGLTMENCTNRFCSNKCQDKTVEPTVVSIKNNCFCDRVCIIYGDCCPDFYSVCVNNSSETTRPGNYDWVASQMQKKSKSVSEFTLSMILFKYRACTIIQIENREWDIWMIAECPESYHITSISSKCYNTSADIIGSVPVTHKVYRFITFRNVFCALCNNVSMNELQGWNTSIECLDNIDKANVTFTSLLHLLQRSRCTLKTQMLDAAEIRFCYYADYMDVVFPQRNKKDFLEHLFSRESRTGDNSNSSTSTLQPTEPELNSTETRQTFLELCGSYRYTVRTNCKHLTRNIHCSQLVENPLPVDDYRCLPCFKTSGRYPFVSLGLLIDFSDHDIRICSNGTSSCSSPNLVDCDVDEVYDYYLDTCRQLVCPEGKFPVNGSCVVNGSLVGDLRHQIFPDGFKTMYINLSYFNTSCELNAEQFLNELSSTLNKRSNTNHSENSTVRNTNITDISTEPKLITLTVAEICLQSEENQSSISKYSHPASNVLNVVLHTLNETNFRNNIAVARLSTFPSNEKLQCKNDSYLTENTNGNLLESNETWFVKHGVHYYPLENIPFVVSIDSNGSSLVEYSICEMNSSRLLDCPMISYPENLTENLNKTLHILGTDLFFSFGQFVFDENQVYVCSNYTRSHRKNETVRFFDFNPTQGILTLICSLFSVFSLALTLIIYLLLPDLQNIPGKIIMSVSFSLMTSQILLLLSNAATGLFCKVLAIALHWSWLSTFIWMTMMATNLVKTFTSKSTAGHSQKLFFYYVTTSVSLPTLIVASSVAVDVADLPHTVIGYGDNDVCWIANKKALMVTFAVPLATLLAVNIVCFVITICAIERSMKMSKTATSTRKDRIKCFIYCKLLIITGLTWTFGFAAAFFRCDWFWYVFIILNGSQGLYIFLCFVLSRRVLNLLKMKFMKLEDRSDFNENGTFSTRL